MSDATSSSVPVSLTRSRDSRRVELAGAATVCCAPTRNLQFLPDGSVRACSQNLWPFGNVRNSRLDEVWTGPRRAELVQRLAVGDMGGGCDTCGAEIRSAGRSGAFAAQFDRLETVGNENWPARLEFSLSEECKLECIHCYGAIQELRRSVPDSSKFGDEFVDQLEPFLVNATEAVFGGGEPLVIDANYRVWDRIAQVAPDLLCTVVTNGTIWNPEIEALFERLRTSFVVSVDGATAATYEAIRVNAEWSEVRAHLGKIRAFVDRRGTGMSINFVLMDANAHELVKVAELADELDIDLSVIVACYPDDCAIGAQGPQRRRVIVESLLQQRQAYADAEGRNFSVVERAVAAALDVCDTDVDQAEFAKEHHRILLFRRAGDGPHDGVALRAELSDVSSTGTLYEVCVGRGDEVTEVVAAPEGVGDGLVGRPAEHLQQQLIEVYGEVVDQQVLVESDDLLDVLTTYSDVVIRTVLVAVRDPDGTADEVRILFCPVDP
ncbi:MAG: radical SAM protein [Actinomycetes bacterium]